jgi:hypothetical protein
MIAAVRSAGTPRGPVSGDRDHRTDHRGIRRAAACLALDDRGRVDRRQRVAVRAALGQ